MTRIGENIRRLRLEKEMSQEELANQIFTTRQTVSNYENGRSVPDLQTIEKLSEIFEVDPETLLYGNQKSELFQTVSRISKIFLIYLFVALSGYIIPMIVAGVNVNNDPTYWGIIISIATAASVLYCLKKS